MPDLDDLLSWADGYVDRVGEPEIRDRPWSTVLRLPTRDGPVWLKVAGSEAGVYRVLADVVPDRILAPLALDEARGLLLLPDGGPTARDGPPETLAARIATALAQYADLQRAVAHRRAAFLAAGVPDASPAVLLDRYDDAVRLIGEPENVESLASCGSDATSLPHEGAGGQRDLVATWAARLADAPGGDLVTLDHQDLHGGNILAGDTPSGHRFYDWGDAAVSHPFTSLHSGLGALARALDVGTDDPAVLAARDAYLERFADLADHDDLVATAEVAVRAALVARSLTWQRAMVTAGPDHPWAGTPRAVLGAVGGSSPFDVP